MNGGTVERWNGGTVERWNGGTAERWNGGTELWPVAIQINPLLFRLLFVVIGIDSSNSCSK
jgi:hypothetical protein